MKYVISLLEKELYSHNQDLKYAEQLFGKLPRKELIEQEVLQLQKAISILNGEIRESCDSIGFYCQREIECNTPCAEQCEHCHDYYKPIEGERT